MHLSQLESEMEDLVPVYSAAKVIQSYIYNYKSFLSAAMICAGWDQVKGPQVYTIPLGGTLVPENIATGGNQNVALIHRQWLRIYERIL